MAYAAPLFAQEEAPPPAEPESSPPAAEPAPAEAAIPLPDSGAAAEALPEGFEEYGSGTAMPAMFEATGSRIKSTDYTPTQPLFVVQRADIERSGLTSIGDVLQNLSVAGPALNTAFNKGGDGSTQIDLRGLGASRALVLVNGRRWVGGVTATATGAVDLNTIPIGLVDRIEVLKDGASAVYGSDAISGVVNIITRKEYVGAEGQTHWALTDRLDGLVQSHNFAVGTENDTTSVFVNFSYAQQQAIAAADRRSTRVPVAGLNRRSRGSSNTPEGHFLFVATQDNATRLGSGTIDDRDSRCYDVSPQAAAVLGIDFAPSTPTPAFSICDLARVGAQPDDDGGAQFPEYVRYRQERHGYNFAPLNYIGTPVERAGVFAHINQILGPDLNLNGEFFYHVRNSAQRLDETPLFVGDLAPAPGNLAFVAADNPFNPFGQDIGRGDPASGAFGIGYASRRLVELGARVTRHKVETMRANAGLDGSFQALGREFVWDGSYTLTQSASDVFEHGLVDMNRVRRALGPVADCTGGGAEAAGCVPLNLFDGPGTITPAMLRYIAYTGSDSALTRQRTLAANLAFDLPELSGRLAGPPSVASGLEFRTEDFEHQPDPLKANGTSSSLFQTPTVGGYDVSEAYAEVGIPLLSGRRYAESLDLSVAARYSRYSSFGDNLSGKLGVRYKPYGDLLLRATYANAFRAPAITDLFLGQALTYPRVADPCSNYDSPDRDGEANIANVRANCAGDGISSSYEQANAEVPVVIQGNRELQPETTASITAGLVYSPEALTDFNLYVDWYSITLEDALGLIGPDLLLSLCYESPPDRRLYCDRVERVRSQGSVGEEVLSNISRVDDRYTNFAELSVQGVDVALDYVLPVPERIARLGNFKLLLDSSYMYRYERVTPGPGGEQSVGYLGFNLGDSGLPRLKANTTLLWNRGPFEASWTLRYIGAQKEVCDDGRAPSLSELGKCSHPDGRFAGARTPLNELDAVFYNDVQGGFTTNRWGFQARFVAGVNNVLRQQPPVSYGAGAASYDRSLYELGDVVGYLRASANF
ncbi:MAG: TonB-dependent receptor [Gammaproteobacteria bacterium]|nr:TonB-dependent receptor [Gammaproteobacteria bacterium]